MKRSIRLVLLATAMMAMATPAAASAIKTTDSSGVSISSGGRSGPWSLEDCNRHRQVHVTWGNKVGACYWWQPTYPGNPGGGYFFDYWY